MQSFTPIEPTTERGPTRLAGHIRRTTHMERLSQDELKAYLMQSSEEFRTLVEKHAEYEHRISEIEAKAHVTPEDEMEEHRLKKLKLNLKDQMLQMMNRYKATEVA
jgi:uncharacterized protein YdcH (DUF465 family)